MPRIEAQPEALDGASGRASVLAGELAGVRGELEATAGELAAALVDGAAGGAASDALTGWAGVLEQLSGYSTGLGANLGGASSAYTRTDGSAMGGAG